MSSSPIETNAPNLAFLSLKKLGWRAKDPESQRRANLEAGVNDLSQRDLLEVTLQDVAH